MRLTIEQLKSCLNTSPLYAGRHNMAAMLTGVCLDSRKARAGDLFICLEGENSDGHLFANQAVAAGAMAILASRDIPDPGAPVFMVENTEKALHQLAAMWRSRYAGKVAAITGTAGKTTLKDILAEILKQKYAIAFTEGNHNNQLGLPLTILNTSGDEDIWLLELGISHAGDMEQLGAIARPDLAVILNIGAGHTEGLGEKGVAWHKSRLLDYVRPGGVALINADYGELMQAASSFREIIKYFGSSSQNFEFSINAHPQPLTLALNLQGEKLKLPASLGAKFVEETILAAAAAGWLLGMSAKEISSGLQRASQPSHRFTPQKIGNSLIYDDTYNANPLSMKRMLEAAHDIALGKNCPLYLILGEMGELGHDAPAMHSELGAYLASLKPAAVYWKGAYGEEIEARLNRGRCPFYQFETDEQFRTLLADLLPSLLSGDNVVLFKGSRLNRLEEHLESLCGCLKAHMVRDNVL